MKFALEENHSPEHLECELLVTLGTWGKKIVYGKSKLYLEQIIVGFHSQFTFSLLRVIIHHRTLQRRQHGKKRKENFMQICDNEALATTSLQRCCFPCNLATTTSTLQSSNSLLRLAMWRVEGKTERGRVGFSFLQKGSF